MKVGVCQGEGLIGLAGMESAKVKVGVCKGEGWNAQK